jgi:hypothetical protein
MGRLRTIKPEFFQHERLFEAEQQTGLPLRLAFIGLWTQADREGRFEWRPLRLKTNVLPWDSVDFAAVLDALAAAGFVVKYAAGEKIVGAIPSWHKHQRPHSNESPSPWPPPLTPTDGGNASSVGASPSSNGASPEHLGGKGFAKDSLRKDSLIEDSLRKDSPVCAPESDPADFESFWKAYPRKAEKRKAHKAWQARRKEGVSANAMLRAAKHYAAACAARRTESRFVKHPATFVGPDRPFEDWLNPPAGENPHDTRRLQSDPGKKYDPALDPYAQGNAGQLSPADAADA